MNLSIKNVPEPIVQRLRERAKLRHRSLQGELLSIVEMAASEGGFLDPASLLAEVRRRGISTPSESVRMIREDRDGR